MHTRVKEDEGTPERVHTREGGGERDDCKVFFFSFANKPSAENGNNCKSTFAEFVLFSRKKKNQNCSGQKYPQL